MCGIAGIVGRGGVLAPTDIEDMIARLRHRGPDGTGQLVGEGFALGHARLAVIDLEGGAQPMRTPDGVVSITYNGELYNFRELRAELAGLGHAFSTASDTEVILEAWREWGPRCVERFRGMFAFGIVDEERRQLFLARDPLGIKPLVYFQDGEEICFASEIQALRARPRFPDAISRLAIDEYLALSYIPAPHTAYEDVRKLAPAHYLLADLDTGRITGPVRYWRIRFEPAPRRSAEEWLRELEGVLRASVRAHLVSDVPVGAFLSGGVDSSLVVSLMAEELGEPIRTFSIGFEEPEFDESRFAREAARRWGTLHRERVVAPDALAILPRLVEHCGEPFGDWSAIPTYHLSALAREQVPVVLSGDGGDEAFAGYDRYLACAPEASSWRGLPAWLTGRRRRRGGSREGWESHAMMVLRRSARRDLWRDELIPPEEGAFDALERAAREAGEVEPLTRAQWVDLVAYLPGAILAKVDVASMCHGLEVRTPLVDREVIEFAATVPTDLLIRTFRDGRSESKHLLRRLLRRWFPDPYVDRPKRGFVPPVREWLRPGSPLRDEVRERLTGPGARIREYFRPAAVTNLLADLSAGGPAEPVWLLLFLETWLEASAGRRV